MAANTRPTLRQVFVFSMLALMLGLSLLFYQVLKGWEQTILQSSERYRDLASREVAQRVTNYLDEAPMAVTQFEQQVKYGVIDAQKIDSVEQGLFSLLLANENISEATYTYAHRKGADRNGNMLIDRASAGQVAAASIHHPGRICVQKDLVQWQSIRLAGWQSGAACVGKNNLDDAHCPHRGPHGPSHLSNSR